MAETEGEAADCYRRSETRRELAEIAVRRDLNSRKRKNGIRPEVQSRFVRRGGSKGLACFRLRAK